jgi:hypothetical protein
LSCSSTKANKGALLLLLPLLLRLPALQLLPRSPFRSLDLIFQPFR